jgi:hypothetical protein
VAHAFVVTVMGMRCCRKNFQILQDVQDKILIIVKYSDPLIGAEMAEFVRKWLQIGRLGFDP